MAGGDNPFPLSEVMAQNIEQTRKAMENYLDFFQQNIKASPWLDTHLSQKNEKLHGAKYCCCFGICTESKQSQGFPRFLADSDRVYASAMESVQ
jgi:hypothetical protein